MNKLQRLNYGPPVTQIIIDVSNCLTMKSLSWLFQIWDYTKLILLNLNIINVIMKNNIGGQKDSMLFIQMILICFQDIIQINLLISGISKLISQGVITSKVTKKTELNIVASLAMAKSWLQLIQKNWYIGTWKMENTLC